MTGRARQRLSPAWKRQDCLALALLVAAWGAFLGRAWLAGGPVADKAIPIYPKSVEDVREKIDPNTAGAASLRRLPLVGPERAGAIVHYRQAAPAGAPAFSCQEDLLKVPGIGPGVLHRAGAFLTLPVRRETSAGP